MGNKSFLITLTIFFFSSLNLFSQHQSTYISGYGSAEFQTSFSKFNNGSADSKSIVGIPYISKEWMYGKLILKDDIELETMFRYNVMAQNIELIIGPDTLIFLHPLKMKKFVFMGKEFIYDISVGNDYMGKYVEGAYLEVLVDGTSQLLRKYEKNTSSSSSGIKYAAAETSLEAYQTRTALYIRPTRDSAPIRIKNSKRSVLHVLSDKQMQLKAYIKDNSLNLSNDGDLISLINFYNSLTNNSL